MYLLTTATKRYRLPIYLTYTKQASQSLLSTKQAPQKPLESSRYKSHASYIQGSLLRLTNDSEINHDRASLRHGPGRLQHHGAPKFASQSNDSPASASISSEGPVLPMAKPPPRAKKPRRCLYGGNAVPTPAETWVKMRAIEVRFRAAIYSEICPSDPRDRSRSDTSHRRLIGKQYISEGTEPYVFASVLPTASSARRPKSAEWPRYAIADPDSVGIAANAQPCPRRRGANTARPAAS